MPTDDDSGMVFQAPGQDRVREAARPRKYEDTDMSYSNGRFSQLRWLQTVLCLAAVVGAGLLIVLGLTGYGSNPAVWMAAAGAFGLFVVVIAMTFAPLLVKIEANMMRQLSEMRDLSEAVAQHGRQLEQIAENTRISDAAKQVAHRQQEIEAVRNAIREDIRREDWEAALGLVEEIERRFGYRQEAERLREELDSARRDAIQKKLARAIEVIEGHFRAHQWDRAQNEIERLKHALPGDAKVLSLMDRMKLLQDQHKQALRAEWQEAVRRNDTDNAINVLKELDPYLSPAEAQSLQTEARNVFKEKLSQLGLQFQFAVNEKRWQDALRIGLDLVRDFPNARMAHEVREVLDTLRERARSLEGQSTEAATARG